jgi:hypothetical protein
VGLWKTIDDETKPRSRWCASPRTGGVLSGKVEKILTRQAGRQVRQVHRRAQGPAGAGHDHHRNVKPNADDKTTGTAATSSTRTTARSTSLRLKPVDGGKKLEVRGYIGPFYRNQTWIRVE